ncbi:MAG TPA: hypothetical protein VEB22_08940, partial [Phycisphaerales bacterium]|nr:hypothetical protein [Phycisphaerales bacterium]
TGTGNEGDTPGVLSALSLQGLRPSSDPLPDLLRATPESLRTQASFRVTEAKPDAPLARQVAHLQREVDETRREVRAKQHERVAVSLSCAVMVMLGAVMGMRLGTAPPLTVYLWSFLPALAGEVAIAGGQTVAAKMGGLGLGLLYGGVAAVAALTLVNYRLLTRH